MLELHVKEMLGDGQVGHSARVYAYSVPNRGDLVSLFLVENAMFTVESVAHVLAGDFKEEPAIILYVKWLKDL